MFFFPPGDSRNKMLVLYFLNALKLKLTKDQISEFALESDVIPYFELQKTIYELEESGYIAAFPMPYGQTYCITASGYKALEYFSDRIPQSQRNNLDMHAEEKREKLRKMTQFKANIDKAHNDTYSVEMSVFEGEDTMLKVSVLLPDLQTARKAVQNWENSSQIVYKTIIENLLQ